MCLQRVTVIVDAVQHHRRNRKHHARRREFSLGQNVMDQAAVHAAVAVLERMDVDETEGGRRRLAARGRAVIAHAIVRLEQAAHEIVADPRAARR